MIRIKIFSLIYCTFNKSVTKFTMELVVLMMILTSPFVLVIEQCSMRLIIKETIIGFYLFHRLYLFHENMFNASILFQTTNRVIILNILTTYKTYSPIFQGRYLFHLCTCTPYFRVVCYLY